MNEDELKKLYEEHRNAVRCPSPILVARFFNNLLGFLFPEFSRHTFDRMEGFRAYYKELNDEFLDILTQRADHDEKRDRELTLEFFDALPGIKEKLLQDIESTYLGDPAARSHAEVIRAYPGFYAMASYRIAHYLYKRNLYLVARMISEHAHNRTGIEIHPAARIGEHFCIDHGTGIVIGETTEIGNHVKIYQGVTLGALSVRKEDAATKRHPTIEDHVVIYAGASILGGETVVGHNSVIGGNVWLTESVPPHSRIYYKANIANEADEQGQPFNTES